MSPTLTTDVSPVLKIQGFNALTRTAASKAPITLSITQSSSPSEIHIKQSTTASIPAVNEEWYPDDNEWRETKDSFLGKVKSRSRWCRVSEVEGGGGFLTEGLQGEEEVVEAVVEGLGSTPWKATQVWCFEAERFVRRVVTEGEGGERAETRLIYELIEE